MAVDTREKRMSMLNFGAGSHLHVTFEVDGAVDLDDRQHLLDCYSGVAFGSPAAGRIMSSSAGAGGLAGLGGLAGPGGGLAG